MARQVQELGIAFVVQSGSGMTTLTRTAGLPCLGHDRGAGTFVVHVEIPSDVSAEMPATPLRHPPMATLAANSVTTGTTTLVWAKISPDALSVAVTVNTDMDSCSLVA
jgi:hypothetical protein